MWWLQTPCQCRITVDYNCNCLFRSLEQNDVFPDITHWDTAGIPQGCITRAGDRKDMQGRASIERATHENSIQSRKRRIESRTVFRRMPENSEYTAVMYARESSVTSSEGNIQN